MRRLIRFDTLLKDTNLWRLANIFTYASVFIFSLTYAIDPDLGWELKYGEYFFKYHEVLKTNIFSRLMPNYYWVNHSWGADAILYAVFHWFGFFGLAIGGAVLITIMFHLFSKVAGLSVLQKVILCPVLLILEYPYLSAGALRTQLMSLFLLSILIYLISEYERGKTKLIYLTIPLLLLWSNIHGEFILGLGIFALWIILHGVKLHLEGAQDRNKQIGVLCGVFGIAALAVLVNPFGIGIYTETFTHFLNPNLHYIIEWQPMSWFGKYWWELVATGLVFCWSVRYLISQHLFKEGFPWIVITAILFVLSLTSRRYMWPFYYLTMPFIAVLIARLRLEQKKHIAAFALGAACIVTAAVFVIKSPLSKYTSLNWDTYCSYRLCSPQAAAFIIDHHLNNDPHLFTDYNLGGWLIWNYPQIKPLIDGRMTIWLGNNGYNPFQDYLALLSNQKDIDQTDYDVAFVQAGEPITSHLAQLTLQGKWELAYGDSRDAVFIKKKAAPVQQPVPLAGQSVVKLPELGVQITVPDDIKDLQYQSTKVTLNNGAPGTLATFSTTTLAALDSSCGTKSGPLGTLVSATGRYPSNDKQATQGYGVLVKQFSSFFISIAPSQAECSTRTSTNTTAGKFENEFDTALSTIQQLN